MKQIEKLEKELNEKLYNPLKEKIMDLLEGETKKEFINRINILGFLYSVDRASILETSYKLGIIATDLEIYLKNAETKLSIKEAE